MENIDYYQQRVTMVDCQVRPSDVTKFPIIAAMLDCPREEFVPDSLRSVAYMGDHLTLAEGRVLLDPRTFSKMLNEIDIRKDEFVLDIGCGLGYSSAIISHFAEAVVALEEDEVMAKEAAIGLVAHAVDNAVAVCGKLSEGATIHAPYDVIVVEGGIELLPDGIVSQLKDGGRIACVFVNRHPGECRIGIKRAGKISWRVVFNADVPVMAGFKTKEQFVF